MYFVYIIKSVTAPDQVYVGKTTNLKKRISDHNCGTTAHTEKYKPWNVIFYAGFVEEIKAIEFEKYLKSGSGREFRKKRLI
jgi:putative endonuclease